jgi:CDP-diacylglycerol--serine O-phosphatidyltransferase
VSDERGPRGITFRAMIPNAITLLALCFGLTGVRFAIGAEWEKALAAIIVAGVLDGMDGRIARLLRAQSKFGAELDSLSDNIAFGTAPALILFLWSLQHAPKFGWTAALALAVCCALRLARFNARLDAAEQPHKSAVALLMISSIPTYSWSSIRIRSGWRLFALAGIAILGAALLTAPWHTLLAVAVLYLAMLPFSLASYARVRRRRASAGQRA